MRIYLGEAESSEGYEDDYQLEDVALEISDFMQEHIKSNFAAAWEELGTEAETSESFALTEIDTIEKAIMVMKKHFGMSPNDRSDIFDQGKTSHTLCLAGNS